MRQDCLLRAFPAAVAGPSDFRRSRSTPHLGICSLAWCVQTFGPGTPILKYIKTYLRTQVDIADLESDAIMMPPMAWNNLSRNLSP